MLDRKRRLSVVRVLTGIAYVGVLFGPGIVYTGNAEPYLSPPPFVFGEIDAAILMFGGAALLFVFKPTRLLRTRYWKATAKAAGLSPVRRGVLTPPECAGTVRGREVRARTGVNGALTSERKARYTVVEAALADEATGGVVVGPADQDGVAAYDLTASPDAETDTLLAVGSDDGLAREVLDGQVTTTLRAVESLDQVYVGDATAAGETLPDDDRIPFGTYPGVTNEIEAAHDDDMPDRDWLGGPGWVSHVSWGTVVDPVELDRQIDAVVTLADAFEQARS